jgi:hypothetical protein
MILSKCLFSLELLVAADSARLPREARFDEVYGLLRDDERW